MMHDVCKIEGGGGQYLYYSLSFIPSSLSHSPTLEYAWKWLEKNTNIKTISANYMTFIVSSIVLHGLTQN